MTIGTIGFEHVNVIDVLSNQTVIIEGAKNAPWFRVSTTMPMRDAGIGLLACSDVSAPNG